MEPVAVVTLFVAFLYVVGRGAYVVSPRATAEFYGRTFFSTDGRLRVFGAALLILMALPLIATARQATGPRDVLTLLTAFGWLAAAGSSWALIGPGHLRKLINRRLSGLSDAALRALGVVSVAFGVFLGAVALFVL